MSLPIHFKTYIILFFLMLSIIVEIKAQKILTSLRGKVEVIRNQNGINHIYAGNDHDLFFTQGYMAAKDRLFQFEIWRRQATGTLAEILGPREIDRDIGARLFKFRGEKQMELNHYHPNGEVIVDAFVNGINAYIKEAREKPEDLPLEFQLLDILPQYWTWEVVVSRHQGLLENVTYELDYSRVVSLLGVEKAKEIYYFHPFEPDLDLDRSIPKELLFNEIIAPYEAFRSPLTFMPEDIIPSARANEEAFINNNNFQVADLSKIEEFEKFSIGSNNWAISGHLTESGYPFMANDPHRRHAIPSLRYWVRLHAPGWDVVGGGEPVIPGVSIGHNDYGAWGLTIFETDNEDLRIYDIDPEDAYRYIYQGEWRNMDVIQDTIQVKGQGPVYVNHYFTVHGPVTFIDESLNKAVAIQAAWLEIGGAPYLASLRMGQSRNWEEFRNACAYNHIPAENMVWADRDGNIGWQATGIAPIRSGFSGLVALPGDGSKEWGGYLPILDRPNSFNPEQGFIATANENLTDDTYPYPEALGYEWADAFRGDRIREVLSLNKKFTIEEMEALQNDYLSIPARILTPYLLKLDFESLKVKSAQQRFSNWDYILDENSITAGIYVMWERRIRANMLDLKVPGEAKPYVGSLQMTKVLQWIEEGDEHFGEESREGFLERCFIDAIMALEEKLGPDMNDWQYGQPDYKHAYIRHPLSAAVTEAISEKLDVGPVARGGYSFTPSANAYGDNNTTGASFRIIIDTGDWEKTKGINTPGQAGDPDSKFYNNLFPVWAENKYFKMSFKKENVETNAFEKTTFSPK